MYFYRRTPYSFEIQVKNFRPDIHFYLKEVHLNVTLFTKMVKESLFSNHHGIYLKFSALFHSMPIARRDEDIVILIFDRTILVLVQL